MDEYLNKCHDANNAFINKNFTLSLQIYNSIINVFPHSKLYSNRGIIHLQLGYVDQALNDFDIALNLDPWNTTAYHYKMNIYELLKSQNIIKEKWHLFEECKQKYSKYSIDLNYFIKNISSKPPESAPQLPESAPQLPESAPQLSESAPQLSESAPQLPESTPQLPENVVSNEENVEHLQKELYDSLSAADSLNASESNKLENPEYKEDKIELIIESSVNQDTSNQDTSNQDTSNQDTSNQDTSNQDTTSTNSNDIIQQLKETEEQEEKNRYQIEIIPDWKKLVIAGNINVNAGKHMDALVFYNEVIAKYPECFDGYLGRGTVYAIEGKLEEALNDLNKAAEIQPNNPDIYRRRFQIYLSQKNVSDTIKDLSMLLKLCPDDIDMLKNRAFYYFQNNLFRQAYKDFFNLNIKQPNDSQWIYIQGLCLNNLGYCMDAVKCFQKVIEMDPNMKDAYVQMSISYRDWSDYSKSFQTLQQINTIQPNYMIPYSLKGLLHYLLGNAPKSIENYNQIIQHDIIHNNDPNIETMYMCAIAYQSMGKFNQAIGLFNKILKMNPKHYAYYQREICYYLYNRLNESITHIQMDVDIMPHLKEVIAKRSPFEEFEKVISKYTHQIPANNISDILDEEITIMGNQLQSNGLLEYIDKLGKKIQYNSPGFLPNKRQHRMAGLAILDAVNTWKQNITDLKNKVPNVKPLTWRKYMDIIVRWRQISEPNDPVWWIDLLTRESYDIGFGLQTPLWGGQLKIPRYYPYFPYAMQIMKQYTLEQYPHTAEMRQKIENATECGELREIMNNDYFVIVPCKSSIQNKNKQKNMEGTRLTIVKKGIDNYDLMIRTPVTPTRWAEFNEELSNIWIQISIELFKDTLARDSLKIMKLFVRFYYYWACFAPLSRGTAAVGFTALVSLFMMMNIEIQPMLPSLKQIDWEAILKNDFENFNSEVYHWIVNDHMKVIENIPNIQPYIQTYRQRLCALNTQIPNLE
jgi:tetratricopeptide (TPR) repeat protein